MIFEFKTFLLMKEEFQNIMILGYYKNWIKSRSCECKFLCNFLFFFYGFLYFHKISKINDLFLQNKHIVSIDQETVY